MIFLNVFQKGTINDNKPIGCHMRSAEGWPRPATRDVHHGF
jgi:hypothetical protein